MRSFLQGAVSALQAVKTGTCAAKFQSWGRTRVRTAGLRKTVVPEVLSKEPRVTLDTAMRTDLWISAFLSSLGLDGITRSITANCLLQEVEGTHICLNAG